jgi:hypothetical protein
MSNNVVVIVDVILQKIRKTGFLTKQLVSYIYIYIAVVTVIYLLGIEFIIIIDVHTATTAILYIELSSIYIGFRL